jgi:hypothetical protein
MTLQLGWPRHPIDIASRISTALRRTSGGSRLIAGFAYANRAGLNAVLGEGSDHGWLGSVQGKWIFGLADAVTEPAALRPLVESRDHEVRFFVPNGRLSLESLVCTPRFHAKFVSIQLGDPIRDRLVWVASANATSAAVGPHSTNFEAGLVIQGKTAIGHREVLHLQEWWMEAWSQSISADSGVLDDYARLRTQFRKRNPGILQIIDPIPPEEIAQSSSLWVEAGAMSGGLRNQIEFNEQLAAFFGPQQDRKTYVDILHRGKLYAGRPLTPKKTTYGVPIWRLGLPTGYTYNGKVILLRRLPARRGERRKFELEVASAGGNLDRRWRATSSNSGIDGSTRAAGGKGPRLYGIF